MDQLSEGEVNQEVANSNIRARPQRNGIQLARLNDCEVIPDHLITPEGDVVLLAFVDVEPIN